MAGDKNIDKLRRAKKDVENFKSNLERLGAFINTRLKSATLQELNLRLVETKMGFDNFIVSQTEVENLDENEYESNTTRANIEDAYYVLRPQLEVQIQFLERQDITVFKPSAPISAPKLPEVHIPSFSGNPLEWTSYFESFNLLVNKNSNLSDLIKFQYLRNSLNGAAADVISALDFNSKNYHDALSLLKERYDNEKYLCEEHIRALFSTKKLDRASSPNLLNMLDIFNSHLRSLTSLGRPVSNWDDLIVHLFVSKLDFETTSKWVDESPARRMATFEELSNFIKSHCHKLELQPQPRKPTSNVPNKISHPAQRSHANSLLSSGLHYKCLNCDKNGHSIYRCTDFLKKSINERRKTVEEKRLCYNCLKGDHISSKCRDSHTCRTCSRKHHSLIHHDENSQPIESSISTSTKPQPPTVSVPSTSTSALQSISNTTSISLSSTSYVFLATAVINFCNQLGQYILGRVILDSGSQLNFMTESFSSKLGLKRFKCSSTVSGIGISTTTASFSSTVTLASRTSNFQTTIDMLILPQIAPPQPSVSVDRRKWTIPSHLQLADPDFYKTKKIDALLGAELFCELLVDGQIRLSSDLPCLQNTVFGWVVSGKSNTKIQSPGHTLLTCLQSSLDLNSSIERFWKLETLSPEPILSSEEKKCEEHYVQNTIRDESGRFVVSLPFSQSPITLGDSSTMAKRRFLSLERRLQRNHELKVAYSQFIDEYLALGHMNRIEDVPENNFYFPHHCVVKPDSSSTKLRVVFDGSAKTSTGSSLNDILMVGPVVQLDLFTILLRFRSHPFVFSADISKMYRQINIDATNHPFQLILWRKDPSQEIVTYKLTTVTYGTAAAPFLATRCLRELSNLYESSHPLGSSVIKTDMYVDDILTGAKTLPLLKKIKQQVIEILSTAGMELRKWYSNCPQILSDVPIEDQEKLLRFDESDYIKTLGVHWQPSSDEFHMLVNVSPSSTVTKRLVISDIARVFDPLGLSAPVITLGKLFMQRLWNMKVGWDEAVGAKFEREWLSYRTELHQLKNLHIPRHLFNLTCPTHIDIHGFADASELAYGAAVYTRCTLPDGTFHCVLLCAKSRVAPLNKVSLPRLELCAAQLCAQLIDKIKLHINFKFSNVFYWSDSSIVLHWIRTPSSSLKTFVANRVSSIQQLTDSSSWRHVDSKNNPADAISRGLTPSQLINHEIWFHGPPFLSQSSDNWPTNISGLSDIEVPELKKVVLSSTISKIDDLFDRIDIRYHASLWRLQRIMAFICRFINNCRLHGAEATKRSHGEPSADELTNALLKLCHVVQAVTFPDELGSLQRREPITSNPLKSLSAFLDQDGLIRVGGRIQYSAVPYAAKHPIVLPKCHQFTLTVIFFYHFRYLHAAPQALLAAVRVMFWPINGRRLAAKVYHNCRVCMKANPKPAAQQMGNLPTWRVSESPPFSTVGVDFCGPIYIHHKAVHIELVGDLSTAAFLGALKRFTATRGLSSHIFSDNGTNFVGTNSALHDIYKMFDNDLHEIQQWCKKSSITWHFAPPGGPHFGGMYEAAVKSIKFHLRRVIANASLTYEEMQTVLKQIEAVLNSRPLTPLSTSPDDLAVLTPGHFLIGRPLMSILDNPHLQQQKLSLLKRWELASALLQHFWSRWRSEYLLSLQQRYKWPTIQENLQQGEMVILKDDNQPPNKWSLARILQVHPGQDGRVRVATIKTANGTYKRPITRLCPLPMIEDAVDGQVRQGGENV